MSKERLTERHNEKVYCPHNIKCVPMCEECEHFGKMMDKLAEYEELEEQGLLLRLPCKVGDTVYQICDGFIEPCTVETIFIGNYVDSNGKYGNMSEIHYDREDCPWVSTEIYLTDIGKTIFLTQSAAEEKLRELEGR